VRGCAITPNVMPRRRQQRPADLSFLRGTWHSVPNWPAHARTARYRSRRQRRPCPSRHHLVAGDATGLPRQVRLVKPINPNDPAVANVIPDCQAIAANARPADRSVYRAEVSAAGTDGLQTRRWRETDSNSRSRHERNSCGERALGNHRISTVGGEARAGPAVRIRFPPAESLQTSGSRSRRPADYRTCHAGYGVKAGGLRHSCPARLSKSPLCADHRPVRRLRLFEPAGPAAHVARADDRKPHTRYHSTFGGVVAWI
jgi:hypothetical protein